MAEQYDDSSVPEVAIGRRWNISPVWIIPIVAFAIAAWLAITTVIGQGPTITIAFETAEGLEAGKTKIKYKNVEVGTVETVALSDDLARIVVTVAMIKGAEPYLTDSTRFWVVRPRLGLREVSGLGTLVSGAFIEVDPGDSGAPKRDFIGLEVAPVISANTPGREFVLLTERLGSVSRGSPVIFRGVEVGEVMGFEFEEDRSSIMIHVFIHAPHHELIHPTTQFWNASGIRFSLDADGMKLETESMQSLILGGIAFETPAAIDPGAPSEARSRFVLYPDRESISEASYTEKYLSIMYFQGSVRGLTVGAPVEFKGLKIGSVVDIKLEFNPTATVFRVPVLVKIEPQRIAILGGERADSDTQRTNVLLQLIDQGLRAQLKTGSFLTGQLFVDLDIRPDAPLALVNSDSDYPEIPTIPKSLDEITKSLTDLVDKLQSLPLEELTQGLIATVKSAEMAASGAERLVNAPELLNAVRSLERTMDSIERLAANADRDLMPVAASALEEAHKTLETVREAVSDQSPLRYDLETMLRELAAAARSIRLLASYLERNPNALIYGKGGTGEP